MHQERTAATIGVHVLCCPISHAEADSLAGVGASVAIRQQPILAIDLELLFELVEILPVEITGVIRLGNLDTCGGEQTFIATSCWLGVAIVMGYTKPVKD